MKTNLVIFLCIVFVSITLQQSDIIEQTPQNNSNNEISNNSLNISLSNYTGDAASIILDFIPYVGNIKNLGEAVLGIDLVTRKNLTMLKEFYP